MKLAILEAPTVHHLCIEEELQTGRSGDSSSATVPFPKDHMCMQSTLSFAIP